MHPRAFVIGIGEVGGRLSGALERSGWSVRPVRRSSGWDAALDETDPSPRVVAVREEDLAPVLARLGGELRRRTVLVQNGFLEAVHGELGPASRGLIYFTSKPDFFRVLGPSTFHGPEAGPLALALARGGIPAVAEPGRPEFLEAMIVKGVWNAVVGLPLDVHGVDLATYLADFQDELRELADEGTRAAGAEYGVAVASERAVRKILDTTAGLGSVRGGRKALAWRNGAIAWFGRRHGVATPAHDRLLDAAGYDPQSDPRDHATS